MTPLQVVTADTPIADSGILVPTAGGNNPDVLGAARYIIAKEPRNVLIICGSPQSRIARLAERHPYESFVEAMLPSGKAGFWPPIQRLRLASYLHERMQQLADSITDCRLNWLIYMEPSENYAIPHRSIGDTPSYGIAVH